MRFSPCSTPYCCARFPPSGVRRPEPRTRSADGKVQGNQSYPDYLACRNARTLAGVTAERLVSFRMAGPPAKIAQGAILTGNYFAALGARPLLGRLLDSDADLGLDAHPVAVLAGIVIAVGLPLAIWARPGLKSVLYGIDAIAPLAIAGGAVLFLAVALAAGFVPARRAATVDPALALRQQ